MIGDVVQGAIRTLAWVSEHMDGSEEIFRYANAGRPDLHDFRAIWSRPTKDKLKILRTWARFLYYRDYWNRLWIVQEVVTAKDVVICCGSDSQCWENLLIPSTRSFVGVALPLHILEVKYSAPLTEAEVYGLARRGPERLGEVGLSAVETIDSFMLGYKRVQRLVANRQRYLKAMCDMSTGDVLGSYGLSPYQDATSPTAGTKCLDRRDIVYAVLALETDASVRGKIAVDYECGIWDLAFRVLKATSDMDHQGSGLWGFSRVCAILRLQGHEKRHLVDLIFADLGEWNEMLIDAVIEVLIFYEDEKQVNLYDLPFKYVKPLPGRPEVSVTARDQQRKSLFAWWTQTQAHLANTSSKRYINHVPACDQCVKDYL